MLKGHTQLLMSDILPIFAVSKGNKMSNNKKIKIMKKYFVNGKEISEKEAKSIEKRNKEYMESGDFSLIAKCEFITVINK